MTVKGVVKNGVVVLEGGVTLADGTHVEVSTESKSLFSDELMKLAGTIEGPPDFARNHDHYIHGTPKK